MTLKVRFRSDALCIDVVGPNGVDQIGVDLPPYALEQPEALALQPALDALNERIRSWPDHPVTCAQVKAERELMG